MQNIINPTKNIYFSESRKLLCNLTSLDKKTYGVAALILFSSTIVRWYRDSNSLIFPKFVTNTFRILVCAGLVINTVFSLKNRNQKNIARSVHLLASTLLFSLGYFIVGKTLLKPPRQFSDLFYPLPAFQKGDNTLKTPSSVNTHTFTQEDRKSITSALKCDSFIIQYRKNAVAFECNPKATLFLPLDKMITLNSILTSNKNPTQITTKIVVREKAVVVLTLLRKWANEDEKF